MALRRTLAALLAALMAANALAMLLAPAWWYPRAPGVTETGPYNHHFIQDIGAAYLVVAFGLGGFAAAPRGGWPALVMAAAFLSLHGAIHVADAVQSPICGHDLARDLPGVFLPALIALGLTLLSIPSKGAFNAQSPVVAPDHQLRAGLDL